MLSRFRRSPASKLRAGLDVDDHAVAVALVERDGEAVRLRHAAVSARGGSDWSRRTSEAAAGTGADLRRVPVTAVVGASAYQLVLVECPKVPPAEVAAAVRWRIRDLVGFPTDNAVIDTIDIPALANDTGRPMVYAIAAEGTAVARQVDAVTGAGLGLDSIDIPEMCLHNIVGCLPQAAGGVALLHFNDEHGTLILSRAGVLYLIRRIDTGLRDIRALFSGDLTTGDVTSDVALEVRRSLDYFESHYDQRPIHHVVLGPGAPAEFPALLTEQLGLDVTTLDLNEILTPSKPLQADQQALVINAIGAALRVNRTVVAT